MNRTKPEQSHQQRCDELLQDLRSKGWVVAIHNDYRMNGEPHTFWLFTHSDGRYIIGEGKTDVEALLICCTHSKDPVLTLDDLCRLDLMEYSQGSKTTDEVARCKGNSCNFCGRWNGIIHDNKR